MKTKKAIGIGIQGVVFASLYGCLVISMGWRAATCTLAIASAITYVLIVAIRMTFEE